MRVQHIATHVPQTVLPVRLLPERDGLDPAERALLDGLGVVEVRDAGPATEVDLAAAAARSACGSAGVAPADLDALVLVQGRAPEYLMSSEATRLQHAIGAGGAFTLGVGELGCVSVSAALTVCEGLFAVHPRWRSVLLAMGARSATPRRFRTPMTVLGDGALAAVLTPDDGPLRLVDQVMAVDGAHSDLFRIRYRETGEPGWYEECTDVQGYSFRLAMESRNRLAGLRDTLLARNGEDPADVTYVMQNLSAGAFEFWQRALDIALSPVCAANLRVHGHLGSADVLLNLAHATTSLRAGDRVVVLNSSPVAAWSAALFEYRPRGSR